MGWSRELEEEGPNINTMNTDLQSRTVDVQVVTVDSPVSVNELWVNIPWSFHSYFYEFYVNFISFFGFSDRLHRRLRQ